MHVELLINHGNPAFFALAGVGKAYLFPLKPYLPLKTSLRIKTAKDFHQSRFACPIFSQQCKRLAALCTQIYIIQRHYARKIFFVMWRISNTASVIALTSGSKRFSLRLACSARQHPAAAHRVHNDSKNNDGTNNDILPIGVY